MKKLLIHVCLRVLPGALVVVLIVWGLTLGKQFVCEQARNSQRQAGGDQVPYSNQKKSTLEKNNSRSMPTKHLLNDIVENIVSANKQTNKGLDNVQYGTEMLKKNPNSATSKVKAIRHISGDRGRDFEECMSELNSLESTKLDDEERKTNFNSLHANNKQSPSGVKGSVKNFTSAHDFRIRQKRIQDVCWKNPTLDLEGSVREVFSHKQAGILYCVVPKAGCTFWKRIFRAFERKASPTKADVYNLSRSEVHDEFHGGKGEHYNLSYLNLKEFPTRFLVARDPFSRLLSAYLDKIYLPDFWNWETKQIAEDLVWQREAMERRERRRYRHRRRSRADSFEKKDDFLRQHFEQIAQTPEFSNTKRRRKTRLLTQNEQTCGKFLTFSEFVHGTTYRPEPHWDPIHKVCNPCWLRVSHVCSMETFTRDARPILDKLGLADVLDDVTEEEQVDKELSTIVHYNFRRVYHERERHILTPCINTRELAFRLWNNFRWRGYIDPEVDYIVPRFSEEKRVRENLLMQLWRARISGLEDREKMKRAKREFRERAFASLSRDLLEKMVEKYKYDFELFGYEHKLDEIRISFQGQ